MTPRQKHTFWTWFWRIAILIIAVLLVTITGNQHQIMIQQTDTLNTLNDMRLEQEDPESEAEPLPEDPVSVHILSPEERDLIERVVAAEARGEDLQTQMGVAQTILDRAELWNISITDVVTAPGQYAGPYKGEISDETKLAVMDVFDGGVRVFEDSTTHFHDDSVSPYWTSNKESRGSLGRLEFWE